jgi:hypothetical protein
MISKIIDLADQINNGSNYAIADISEWETVSIQAIGLAGTMTIAGTINGGEITGTIDGNKWNAADYVSIQAINLTTGAGATAVTGTSIFRINPVGFQYLRLGDGSSALATKLLLFCSKPY